MREVSLNEPLSGEEIKAIVLTRIADALGKDSTLANDITYAGVEIKWTLEFKYVRSPTSPGTSVWGGKTLGEPVGKEAEVQTVAETYVTDSPNAAREDHDLLVPVLVNTPAGPEKRMVPSPRKGPRK